MTDNVQVLDSTNFRQRYFPHVTSKRDRETYEPEGVTTLICSSGQTTKRVSISIPATYAR